MGKYIESLRTRIMALNVLLDEAERIGGTTRTYSFSYVLNQDSVPNRQILTVTYRKEEVISIEYVFNKSITPQISESEDERIFTYLIEELLKQTRNGFAPLLAKKFAFGITHHLRRLEAPDEGVDLMAAV